MGALIFPEIDSGRCDGCGRCVTACAPGALALSEGKAVLSRPNLCQWDSDCELICPTGAIQVPFVVVFEAGIRGGGDGETRGHGDAGTR